MAGSLAGGVALQGKAGRHVRALGLKMRWRMGKLSRPTVGGTREAPLVGEGSGSARAGAGCYTSLDSNFGQNERLTAGAPQPARGAAADPSEPTGLSPSRTPKVT